MLGPLEDTLGDRELHLSDRNKSNLEAVQRNSVRLLKLVNSLLDFSRLESNRLNLKFQRTDLAQLTCDLASSFRSACEKAGLSLNLDCSAEDAVAYVDREMWEKIILNLVSNAFKYTLKGSIAIRTESNLDQVRITVEDTGVGIPETDRENVFKRFHRVHRSEGRSHEGSGIGLALVDEAVRLHGGSIRLESQIGKGSRFTISIPKGKAHLPQQLVEEKTVEARTLAAPMLFAQEATSLVERDSNQRSVAKTKKSARILLAEDNHDMRDYITRLLEDRFDVIAVKDGQEALNLIGEEMPDIVLSDIMMPKLDGIELLNRIRSDQHLRSLPVILLSARAGEEARIEGLEMTADDYLIKPFTARELIARISTHLDLARVRKESLEREQTLRSEAVAAKRSSELKDQFLATVSHELRTPLNIIRGHSDLLRDTDLTENEKLESLDAIQRNVDAQTKIIEDLLDLSRLMSGKLHLDAKDLNLTEVIQSAVENITTAIKAKQLALQTDFGSCAAFVKGDPVRLSQIVWNLLSNSVKFTPSGGRVSVRCELKEKLVEIKVADSGIGIAPEFLPYAFDVFRQEDSAYTRKHGGLGLGLAIVRELAEAHGGSIRVESEGRGKGTTFTLALPTINFNQVAESTPASERPTTSEKLKGLRLLAVDDHPETLDLISMLLQKAGAKVFKANSAAEAYDKLFEVRPDVLISDISMPVEDGYSLIKRIRSLPVEKGGSIPAVAVTAFTRDIDRKKAIQAGFHAHLGKPVDRLQLVDTIQKLTSIVPSIVSAESAKSTTN
jgi:signal transduction histidine kinase